MQMQLFCHTSSFPNFLYHAKFNEIHFTLKKAFEISIINLSFPDSEFFLNEINNEINGLLSFEARHEWTVGKKIRCCR